MRRTARGFTLVELLTVLAIAAITLGIGLPAFKGVRARIDAATASNRLTTSLMVARSTAIMRREPVAICASLDGEQCAGARDWHHGWIVFLDADRSGRPANALAVLARGDAVARMRIVSTSGRPLVRFQADGRSSGANATFSLCSGHDGTLASEVVLNNSGRVRTARPSRPVPCPT